MNKRSFQALLNKATKVATERASVQSRLTDAFNERYGATYSDVDADQIIDVLDYNGGIFLSVDEVDAIMSDHGAPKLSAKDKADT